ncbi:MAG TPA: universal stress protein [Chthonomonadales bacterium]|nr:universal stress protein [Chthonomonadales bacterium]
MIIENKDDVVKLSGSLRKNQWMSIRAAANLLLHDHPEGIIIDCSGLGEISEAGARTFLEAMRDIESANARIVVACLPKEMLAVCKQVPGVRSQLPVAESVEAARASLRLVDRTAAIASHQHAARQGQLIIVPLLADLDLTYGAHLAGRLARAGKAEVQLIYFLAVARNLPLGSPLVEEERAARESLDRAVQFARQVNVNASEHVERVREATDGILTVIRSSGADMVVIGAASEPIGANGHDRFHDLVDTLLHRAACEVVIGRLSPAA